MTDAALHVKLPERDPVLSVVPMPADANPTGDIFGGWIMSQVDIAGSIPALRLAKGRIATVAVNSFTFKQPVLIGDLVSFYAQVARVGRTSITVTWRCMRSAARRRSDGEGDGATLTYVAVDAERRPRPVRFGVSRRGSYDCRPGEEENAMSNRFNNNTRIAGALLGAALMGRA
jgi:acyl-CoA thioesterase YciA